MSLVSVDRDFARFGGKSYAINKINTVEVRERKPHAFWPVLVLGFLGGIFLLSGFGQLAALDGAPWTSIIFGATLLGLAAWQWRRSKVREYKLFLMTSSSEAQAYTSNNFDEVMGLRREIESAMAGR
jgi:hypothetical protein